MYSRCRFGANELAVRTEGSELGSKVTRGQDGFPSDREVRTQYASDFSGMNPRRCLSTIPLRHASIW